MKALVYNGPKDVSIAEVPEARIERPTDVVIKITATNPRSSCTHDRRSRFHAEEGTAWLDSSNR